MIFSKATCIGKYFTMMIIVSWALTFFPGITQAFSSSLPLIFTNCLVFYPIVLSVTAAPLLLRIQAALSSWIAHKIRAQQPFIKNWLSSKPISTLFLSWTVFVMEGGGDTKVSYLEKKDSLKAWFAATLDFNLWHTMLGMGIIAHAAWTLASGEAAIATLHTICGITAWLVLEITKPIISEQNKEIVSSFDIVFLCAMVLQVCQSLSNLVKETTAAALIYTVCTIIHWLLLQLTHPIISSQKVIPQPESFLFFASISHILLASVTAIEYALFLRYPLLALSSIPSATLAIQAWFAIEIIAQIAAASACAIQFVQNPLKQRTQAS